MRVLLIVFSCAFALGAASLQKISVKGRVTCATPPGKVNNIHVKLIDEDTGLNPDDLLAQGLTDSNGAFSLSGQTSEIGRIDPVLKIYHDCNDGVKPCQRRFKAEIPKRFINKDTPFDVGVISLDTADSSEERDCNH